jgi:L-2-hydroxyglutarate oxidase LhgO
METIKYTIIGAGVIGCAIAYELSKRVQEDIFVLDSNPNFPGENQSSRNSGVIHAGIYYPKDTEPLKSRLCVEGNELLYKFCNEHDVPHKRTGKLVVATSPLEEEYLNGISKIAEENGIRNTKIISRKEVQEYEPHVEAISALYVPSSGIVEPTSLVAKLANLADQNGVHFMHSTKVTSIKPSQNSFQITTDSETFSTNILVNSAGLDSSTIAGMINSNNDYDMYLMGGEFASFQNKDEISMNGVHVYPVPYGIYPNGSRAIIGYNEFEKLLQK